MRTHTHTTRDMTKIQNSVRDRKPLTSKNKTTLHPTTTNSQAEEAYLPVPMDQEAMLPKLQP